MLFKKSNKTEQQDIEDYILMQASPRFVSDDKRELSYHEKQELEMLFQIWDDDQSGPKRIFEMCPECHLDALLSGLLGNNKIGNTPTTHDKKR